MLSAWPHGAAFQLGRTWRYGGKLQQLVPGLYRWYVWPARGSREQPRFGPRARLEQLSSVTR